METIKNIKKLYDHEIKGYKYEGFEVETSEQKIYVLVSAQQSCCERTGFISSLDDYNEFVGSTLLKVEIVDDILDKVKWEKEVPYGLYEGGVIFVNFETDKGTFQLTVYNSQNGFYGHEALVISKDLNIEEIL